MYKISSFTLYTSLPYKKHPLLLFSFSFYFLMSPMVPELEKPRVTEIKVRMDCNGCVQKIKKALHGINGIYDLYIDFPQQKLTVVGWADPEKIIKAIKKTRKIATICVHAEPTEPPAQPTEQAPPAPDAANPPPESPPAEAAPPTEPPKDPPPPENPPPEATPPPAVPDNGSQPQHPSGPKDVEEIHVIHHHPPDYSYGYNTQWSPRNHHPSNNHPEYWNSHPIGHGFQPEPPVRVSHSYNRYRPSPYISEYEYGRSPPRQPHNGSRMEPYSEEYRYRGNGDGNNITSMFSDENPNACRIV